jgi:hypothetical protein
VHDALDTVVAVEASYATEAMAGIGGGRASADTVGNGAAALGRVALSVTLRWALLKLSYVDGLDALLTSELGAPRDPGRKSARALSLVEGHRWREKL